MKVCNLRNWLKCKTVTLLVGKVFIQIYMKFYKLYIYIHVILLSHKIKIYKKGYLIFLKRNYVKQIFKGWWSPIVLCQCPLAIL